jgi:hypothetical protein
MSSSRIKDASGTDAASEHSEHAGSTALTPQERARLVSELQAELEAAERSIREEGTVSAKEFLKRCADYWSDLADQHDESSDDPGRRNR